ncbi:MAG: PHP domain-containing protein [Firmicutes bacterium]|nr:PHP domain-containing protein [Bacillota bacterium]
MPVDLHLHTTASDGSLSPGEVVEIAASLNLKTIAISDHDTVGGIDEALAYAIKLGIEVIPAVELSSKYNSRDVHILGYFIDYKDTKLLDYFTYLRQARIERAKVIIDCLRNLGLNITFEDVLKIAEQASIGRPHIARALLAKNYVPDVREAFNKYLKHGAPCFREKFVYPTDKAISLVHEAGGIAVFAHPGLAKIDEYIPELIKMGLNGLEAYHAEHTADQIEHYLRLAKEYGLIVTGGSDDHGPVSTHGLRIGSISVPDAVVDTLKLAANKERQ